MCHQNGSQAHYFFTISSSEVLSAICPSATLSRSESLQKNMNFNHVAQCDTCDKLISITHILMNNPPSAVHPMVSDHKTADLSTLVCPAADFSSSPSVTFSSSSSSSSFCPPCVLPDQHHDTAPVRAADPEAQPAHPPQLGPAQPRREELPGEQAAGGAGAPGERAAPRCCVRTDRRPK